MDHHEDRDFCNPQHLLRPRVPCSQAPPNPQVVPPPPLPINRSSRLRRAVPRLRRAVGTSGTPSLTGRPTMTITYSCVANGRAVLAELALTGGSYQVPAGSAPRGWRPPGLPSSHDAG
ncbi:hypothetical protein NN561_007688 [Cricetulus griseus]